MKIRSHELQELKWWDWNIDKIAQYLPLHNEWKYGRTYEINNVVCME